MSYPHLLIEKKDNVAMLIINRPDKLNALNRDVINQLSDCFQELNNDLEVKAIILTGAGDKAFVAGADISEFAHDSVEEGKRLSADGHDKLFDLVENLNTPVIAAVNGFALGGGLELAMSCHMRVVSTKARMGLPEVSLGVIPGYGGTQRLAQLVGKGKAMEMITTAQMINAEEAYRLGLANYTVEPEELINKCYEITKSILKNSPIAIAFAMKAVNAGFRDGVNGYEKEIELFGEAFGTNDFKEGTTAFLEKRKAEFKGE